MITIHKIDFFAESNIYFFYQSSFVLQYFYYRVSKHNCGFCFARETVNFKDIRKLFSELYSAIFGNFLEILISLITDKLITIWLIFDNFLKNDSNTNLRVFIFLLKQFSLQNPYKIVHRNFRQF